MRTAASRRFKEVDRPRQRVLAVRCLGLVVVVGWTALVPVTMQAHGELHLRIAAVTSQIQTNENSAELYLQRGELYREDGSWEAAESDYQRAAQLGVDAGVVDRYRAMLLRDSGNFELARTLFDSLIQRNPQDGDALIGRARLYAKMGHSKAAAADFGRALQHLATAEHGLYDEWAQAIETSGDTAGAIAALERGIQKVGPIPALQRHALDLDLKLENYNSALARIQVLLELASRKEEWLTRRGEILMRLGRISDAKESFHAALVAIDSLPKRIRDGAAMVSLQSRIRENMAQTTIATNRVRE